MSKKNEINHEDFGKLLDWLDENREEAALRYETIRLRLIKIFTIHKHFDAEDLADQVFDRVCRKLPEISLNYEGKKELYFYGVARKINLEAQKRVKPSELETNKIEVNNSNEENNDHFQCLEVCLQKLPKDEKDLIISYYQNEKTAKIDYRKGLAERLGITLNFLRIKIFRLRNELKKCVLDCLKTA